MIGQTISHYRITEKLGEGGMDVVYKAEDTKLERAVALKFLAPQLLEDEEARKRFTREAKAAAALDHPNVCNIYEIDEADDQTFLAMAYVEGKAVRDKVQKRPLKLDEALDIAAQTAQGLRAQRQRSRDRRFPCESFTETARDRLRRQAESSETSTSNRATLPVFALRAGL